MTYLAEIITTYEREQFPLTISGLRFGDDILVAQVDAQDWCVFRESDGAYLDSNHRWSGADDCREGPAEVPEDGWMSFDEACRRAAQAYADSTQDD